MVFCSFFFFLLLFSLPFFPLERRAFISARARERGKKSSHSFFPRVSLSLPPTHTPSLLNRTQPPPPLLPTTGAAVASRQRREQEEEEGRKRAKKLREESESSEGESSAPSSPTSAAALSLLRGRPPLSPSSPTYWGCPVCRKPHALLPSSETGEKGGTVERWGREVFLFTFRGFFFFFLVAQAPPPPKLTVLSPRPPLSFFFRPSKTAPQEHCQGQQ